MARSKETDEVKEWAVSFDRATWVCGMAIMLRLSFDVSYWEQNELVCFTLKRDDMKLLKSRIKQADDAQKKVKKLIGMPPK